MDSELAFEWDPAKETSNRNKHGVAFDEAMTVFGDPLSIVIPDPDHSIEEERCVIVGQAVSGILKIVSLTQCGEKLRLISARRVSPWERRQYEQGS